MPDSGPQTGIQVELGASLGAKIQRRVSKPHNNGAMSKGQSSHLKALNGKRWNDSRTG